MNLLDIVRRANPLLPWTEGEKIPWDEAEFSARMLHEHLSQVHDHASRRATRIRQQVRWLHERVLGAKPALILDLACGPGLYTAELATLGHRCVGIDFSPAAIGYARAVADAAQLACTYQLGDIRKADYGEGFALVLLISGELNVFRPADARMILRKARLALATGGQLLLEVHTDAAVHRIGNLPRVWQAAEHGLFSRRPHLRLDESAWDAGQGVATRRYLVVDAESSEVAWYTESIQAYTAEDYVTLLRECGFALHGSYPAWDDGGDTGEFLVLVGVAA